MMLPVHCYSCTPLTPLTGTRRTLFTLQGAGPKTHTLFHVLTGRFHDLEAFGLSSTVPTLKLDQPSNWTNPQTGPALKLDQPSNWNNPQTGPALKLDQPSNWTNPQTGPTLKLDQRVDTRTAHLTIKVSVTTLWTRLLVHK